MYRLIPLIFILAACGGSGEKTSTEVNTTTTQKTTEIAEKPSPPSTAPVGPGEKERVPEPPQEFAVRILKAIKSGDIKRLASMVAPEGVILSPDVHIDPEKDVRLKPEELLKAWEENKAFVWGYEAGSGRPIEMGIRDFFKKYLYDRDYLNAPKVAVNERLGRGSTKDNVKEVFPDAVFVEFHFPGTEKNGGMDWSSLRVVMRKYGEGWNVVAIVRDNWTP